MSDLAFLPATEQAAMVRRTDVSPVELVELYVERIEKLNPTLNAYVTVAADQALDAAREAQRRLQEGGETPPFLGVPIPIKDLNETAGIRTTFSSKAYADYVPTQDAAVVRRLKEAGFIVLAKTNTPEFGTLPVTESELNGVARNPWDTDRTPGGSSGGSGAALAAGMCPVAQGNDGGGSIRIPASCNGLFGLKPTRGRVSWGPRFGDMWAGFAINGPIARTVLDAASVLDVMAGYEPGDPYWLDRPARPFAQEVGVPPGALRIALTTLSPAGTSVHPDSVAAVEDAAALLESLGHHVEPADPPWADQDAVPLFMKIFQTNAAYYEVPPEVMEPVNRAYYEAGQETTSIEYVQAVMGIQRLSRRIIGFLEGYDLVLTPTLGLPPVPIGWCFQDDNPWMTFLRAAEFTPFTAVANLTGQPAVSLPLRWNDDGLPIGSHLIGRPGDEATLLRVSAQVEQARPWADRRPPVS